MNDRYFVNECRLSSKSLTVIIHTDTSIYITFFNLPRPATAATATATTTTATA